MPPSRPLLTPSLITDLATYLPPLLTLLLAALILSPSAALVILSLSFLRIYILACLIMPNPWNPSLRQRSPGVELMVWAHRQLLRPGRWYGWRLVWWLLCGGGMGL
ncbi:hypothetical protein K458DRAFT_391202 [Lentithecium fluviatile CBS 122367]|uniref:Uncharacterized protein n=1 Tax=Lentithecium fluviatile CBS 122367 TaxID=1168545 RepID=A0A6G1IW61_9PLEO|nr:hypothetical protein K458DRAFT_391202 [Lentithecium fluviatile CBS 122367]